MAQKSEDPALLAHALGLLSPQKTKSVPYKPSLLRHLQKGPVSEHYSELKNEAAQKYTMPDSSDHVQSVSRLLMDLEAATSVRSHRQWSSRSMAEYVKTLTSEEELLELVRLAYYQNRLNLPLMTRFMLNKSLRRLHLLPFDVDSLETDHRQNLASNGWTAQNMVEFRVVLMKKYHDLGRPLDIARILRHSFDSDFLPLIRQTRLSPFYERIVWRFYFEYGHHNDRDESYFVRNLNSVRSAVSMWEASAEGSFSVAKTALTELFQLSPLQKTFFRLCTCKSVKTVVSAELASSPNGRSSRLLSGLKRISIKYNVPALSEAAASSDVASRAHVYSFIHALMALVEKEVPNWRDARDLVEIVGALEAERSLMADVATFPDDLAMA